MLFLNEYEKSYLKSKPISFRILIFIIALKPIINSFWDVTLPLVNVTVLQFSSILIIFFLFFGLFNSKSNSITFLANFLFGSFSLIYFANLAVVILNNFDLSNLKTLVKVAVFPLSFYYARKTICNFMDLNLILNSFIKSIIPAVIIGFYDVFIVQSYEINRGIIRYDSSFGDIANIGLHINVVMLVLYYYLLVYKNQFKTGTNTLHILFFLFSVFMLSKISHASSFGVFVAINALYIVFRFKLNIFKLSLLVFVFLILSSFIASDWIFRFYNNFLSKEINSIISGEFFTIENKEDIKFLFHGRLGRWLIYLEDFSKISTIKKYFGGYAIEYPYVFGHALHNDIFRIFMSTGYIGLMFYISYLFYLVIFAFRKCNINDKFLLFGIILLVLLYSISLTPTSYIDVSILFSVIVLYILKKGHNEKNNPIFR